MKITAGLLFGALFLMSCGGEINDRRQLGGTFSDNSTPGSPPSTTPPEPTPEPTPKPLPQSTLEWDGKEFIGTATLQFVPVDGPKESNP